MHAAGCKACTGGMDTHALSTEMVQFSEEMSEHKFSLFCIVHKAYFLKPINAWHENIPPVEDLVPQRNSK